RADPHHRVAEGDWLAGSKYYSSSSTFEDESYGNNSDGGVHHEHYRRITGRASDEEAERTRDEGQASKGLTETSV
ncbi:hypothetical protein Dimus_036131, partial [Dionaea muscipula]